MNHKQSIDHPPSPTIQSADPAIEVISLMKRHYRAIRTRLPQPYTHAFEVAVILMRLKLLGPGIGLSAVQHALKSQGLNLRDRSVKGSRNVYFPLLVHGIPEDHLTLSDLVEAEMIEDRF